MPHKFYHRTSNIEDILRAGKLTPLDTLAREYPEKSLSIEPNRWDRDRENMSIADAVKVLKEQGKRTDAVYLSKDAPLEGDDYGDYIIEKELQHPKESDAINFIPNEYTSRRSLSLKRTAKVYAPDSQVERLSKINKKVPVVPLSEYKDGFHESYSIPAFIRKLQLNAGLAKTASLNVTPSNVKSLFGRNATLVGSRGLGTSVNSFSDTDVLLHYQKKAYMDKAIARLSEKYGLRPSKYNSPNKSRQVYSTDNLDVVFSTHPDVKKHLDSYINARDSLTNEQRQDIIATKKRFEGVMLPEFVKNVLYKKYKRDLDKKLGIQRL